ncbi:hypothetical protein [Gordonia hankookensis]|uniref:Uncharacterized protein n=1 Tax=Gordonia hankookensis TaxID=589403 RepID=A0ABR7W5Z6_9ACTN|nr:hypothetical protein [Gordonia hankookensis]MBD1318000.1 hypothetical protein [Gordonia hankookensis]
MSSPSRVPDRTYIRRRAVAGGALTVLTVISFYALPILARTVCIHFGLCSGGAA